MDTEQIPSVLGCDCGNSTIRIARVRGDEVTSVEVFHLDRLQPLGEALKRIWNEMPDPKAIVAGSVNPAALKALEAAAKEATQQEVLVVGRDLPLPLDTRLKQPGSIGVDRLCCAAGAFDRLGVACVVADYGTAVTIDCVNSDGVFLGGAIMPGLHAGAEMLHKATAQLPKVDLSKNANPHWVFGADTREAILGGLVYGARGALRERVEVYAAELGSWPLVILTGGDAKLISPNPGQNGLVQAIVDDLCLCGIAIAYYRTLTRPK